MDTPVALKETGDLIEPVKRGLIKESEVIPLWDLIQGKVKISGETPIDISLEPDDTGIDWSWDPIPSDVTLTTLYSGTIKVKEVTPTSQATLQSQGRYKEALADRKSVV
mgnify:CR=1 FL=1